MARTWWNTTCSPRPVSLELFSQGGAFVHNLIGGTVRLVPVHDRATPYHRPHSTQVKGYAIIYSGDDRWIGNIFLGGDIAKAYGYDTTQDARSRSGLRHRRLRRQPDIPRGLRLPHR